MNPRAWFVGAALGLAVVIAVYVRKNYDTGAAPILLGGPEPSPKVRAAATAIARAEGFFVPGSIPQRAHNPGNLKLGGKTINGITVFDSDGQGWAALYRQLNLIVSGTSRVYTLGDTLRSMGAKWAPSGGADFNIAGAWGSNVATYLGVSVDTTLRQVLA